MHLFSWCSDVYGLTIDDLRGGASSPGKKTFFMALLPLPFSGKENFIEAVTGGKFPFGFFSFQVHVEGSHYLRHFWRRAFG